MNDGRSIEWLPIPTRWTMGRSRAWWLAGALMVVSIALVLTLSPARGQPAQAPGTPRADALAIELAQSRIVVGADGREQQLPADTIRPGDVVEYRALYRNRSAQPLTGVVATLPLPTGLEYLPRSAGQGGRQVEAAASDGRYAAEPLVRKVLQPDGRTRDVPVPYADYRSLRWQLGRLQPGDAVVVTARAQVSPLGSLPATGPVATTVPVQPAAVPMPSR